jgi:hypothetical protein
MLLRPLVFATKIGGVTALFLWLLPGQGRAELCSLSLLTLYTRTRRFFASSFSYKSIATALLSLAVNQYQRVKGRTRSRSTSSISTSDQHDGFLQQLAVRDGPTYCPASKAGRPSARCCWPFILLENRWQGQRPKSWACSQAIRVLAGRQRTLTAADELMDACCCTACGMEGALPLYISVS